MSDNILILIDIQRGFLDPQWGKRNNPHFEQHVAALLQHWREHNQPIIHVRHLSLLEGSPLSPGQPGHHFMDCAQPLQNEEIISKNVNSAFIGTDLLQLLSSRKAKKLVFAGLTTDHCVSTSVRMAANFSFECVVASDATATFSRIDADGTLIDPDLVQRVTLASLRGEFATILENRILLSEGQGV
jgi:nicotinamidase-related amidase